MHADDAFDPVATPNRGARSGPTHARVVDTSTGPRDTGGEVLTHFPPRPAFDGPAIASLDEISRQRQLICRTHCTEAGW